MFISLKSYQLQNVIVLIINVLICYFPLFINRPFDKNQPFGLLDFRFLFFIPIIFMPDV